jgi:hypothetical protein
MGFLAIAAGYSFPVVIRIVSCYRSPVGGHGIPANRNVSVASDILAPAGGVIVSHNPFVISINVLPFRRSAILVMMSDPGV